MKTTKMLCFVLLFGFSYAKASVYPTLPAMYIGNELGMVFKSKTIDYGVIKKGSEPLRQFIFTNQSQEPLIITNAKGSCGCTIADYPKTAIMPGKTANIDVRYDTNRLGKFSKTVTVTTAKGDNVVLTISGEVVE